MALMTGRLRAALLVGCAGAALAAAMPAAAAAEGPARQYAIGSMDLDTALREFAMTSGHDVVFDPALVRGHKTAGVTGQVSDEAALRELLRGTDLAFEQTSTGGFVVRAPRFQAAAEGGSGNQVEALIVTAQKREEDIQDVPIAISAFTQEDLTRSQVAGGPDLITQVPNMTFTKTNFSSYSVQLRGIGTQAISATTDPAVAVAFNNTPFIRNRFFEQEFYDLQRVEVLRGPQGTLYGRNATAGVVNIISAKPKFFTEAKLSGDVSNYNSSRLEGMVNIPLVEDVAALRIAGAWTKRDGYATNQLTGNPIDGRDLWSTRVSLRVQPSDRLDINLIWEHFEENDDRLRSGKQLCRRDLVESVGGVPVTDYFQTVQSLGQGGLPNGIHASFSQGCERESLYSPNSFQTPVGLMLPYYLPLSSIGLPAARQEPYVNATQSRDLRVIESAIDPVYRAKNNLGELQISFDLTDTLTLASETAFAVDNVYSLQDFNRFNTAPGAWDATPPSSGGPNRYVALGILTEDGFFCDPQLGCSDRLVAVDISTADATQFSQEFRLSSNFDGAFNFSLGGNFLRADSVDKYYVFINSISLLAAYGIGDYPPYVSGVTDNSDCLMDGYAPGDPFDVFPVRQCTYIDPNPIESVNDRGHNYFLSKNPYKLISYAVFGEAYYNVTDTLKITAGLRWTVDKKEAPIVPSWILISQSVGYPVAEVLEQEWREPTGRLTADWKPDLSFTDETLLYASYAHGYKAGGANPPGFIRNYYGDAGRAVSKISAAESLTRPKTFAPEFVDAFELGAKNTFLDGRATANLAAFYYDYKDYQISEIVDRAAFNRNFDATVWGIELESDWRPVENFRLGVKVGYEETAIGDHERAIDLMDRTAGRSDWMLVRPFPTYPSSCVLPTYVFVNEGVIRNPSGVSGGGMSSCEYAYQAHYDPLTQRPYVENPTAGEPFFFDEYVDYPGFNPDDASQGHNNGEGFLKDIGGNELPNAPNLTATITADYTLPLPNEWLATLHTDLHWQGQSDWRVFQDHEYSVLDEYFTMNLAAIFTNEERGWNIMAYIKNVTDETAITGAFLNSDDTGLTTNVFMTEPRLYGLRVTKAWMGGSTLGSLGAPREGPYPLTVEIGGQVQRHDAPNVTLHPAAADVFEGPLDIMGKAQAEDLDWGDGGDLKVTLRPGSGPWSLTGAYRFGKTNGQQQTAFQRGTEPVCAFPDDDTCADYAAHPKYYPITEVSMVERADAPTYDRESHAIVDFSVGKDLGLGGLASSTLSAGLRYARLESKTDAKLYGIPEWRLQPGFYVTGYYPTHELVNLRATADRDFSGLGPQVTWDAAASLLKLDNGQFDAEWSLGGGVLFGERETTVRSTATTRYYSIDPTSLLFYSMGTATVGNIISPFQTVTAPPEDLRRSSDATVPTVNASLGLSFKAGAFKMGAGYRWERYFDAIDGGYQDEQSQDRTIDGPYFRVSMGFGG